MLLWCVIRLFSIGLGMLVVGDAGLLVNTVFLPPLACSSLAECCFGVLFGFFFFSVAFRLLVRWAIALVCKQAFLPLLGLQVAGCSGEGNGTPL